MTKLKSAGKDAAKPTYNRARRTKGNNPGKDLKISRDADTFEEYLKAPLDATKVKDNGAVIPSALSPEESKSWKTFNAYCNRIEEWYNEARQFYPPAVLIFVSKCIRRAFPFDRCASLFVDPGQAGKEKESKVTGDEAAIIKTVVERFMHLRNEALTLYKTSPFYTSSRSREDRAKVIEIIQQEYNEELRRVLAAKHGIFSHDHPGAASQSLTTVHHIMKDVGFESGDSRLFGGSFFHLDGIHGLIITDKAAFDPRVLDVLDEDDTTPQQSGNNNPDIKQERDYTASDIKQEDMSSFAPGEDVYASFPAPSGADARPLGGQIHSFSATSGGPAVADGATSRMIGGQIHSFSSTSGGPAAANGATSRMIGGQARSFSATSGGPAAADGATSRMYGGQKRSLSSPPETPTALLGANRRQYGGQKRSLSSPPETPTAPRGANLGQHVGQKRSLSSPPETPTAPRGANLGQHAGQKHRLNAGDGGGLTTGGADLRQHDGAKHGLSAGDGDGFATGGADLSQDAGQKYGLSAGDGDDFTTGGADLSQHAGQKHGLNVSEEGSSKRARLSLELSSTPEGAVVPKPGDEEKTVATPKDPAQLSYMSDNALRRSDAAREVSVEDDAVLIEGDKKSEDLQEGDIFKDV
ncbi:hypothetical protein LTR56_005728 [Elasticomyces elasticus]|nr:hypothetical protein LTR56_005728 [Elasticomyces elasticus]